MGLACFEGEKRSEVWNVPGTPGRKGETGRDGTGQCRCRRGAAAGKGSGHSAIAPAPPASPAAVNNPIPSNLKSEAKKAAKILREFTEITSRNGPDKIIPPHVIAKAKGLAVLSVIKAGFLVTARGGSGIVLARLPNGTWSAPSAIGIAGLGGGFEIGIEVSDLVIILNHERAVEAFAKGGNLTLGGNLTVAIGPLGRNLEGDVALRSSAAVYTYCKSRGLFAGVSLEGTCLIERKETNRKFYGQDIRASAILLGDVPFPAQADDLYETLASFTEVYENEEQKNNPGKSVREQRRVNERPARPSTRPEPPKPTVRPTPPAKKNTNKLYPELPNDYASGDNSGSDPVEVTALYSFEGQQPGDLTFKAGDRITVTTKTNSQFDWWEGTIGGKTGIFPANYVAISNN
ncbi:SH3 domain-containing YSC84-like protein 1 isoform X1 [Zonotrichia albicollis]|uniref:SH3 domain-containing YSC84-like protein 1 isoform X1 n=1 Tax=Zonotrichia albicollis TaxID=44394 RepID=UPI003D8117AA